MSPIVFSEGFESVDGFPDPTARREGESKRAWRRRLAKYRKPLSTDLPLVIEVYGLPDDLEPEDLFGVVDVRPGAPAPIIKRMTSHTDDQEG